MYYTSNLFSTRLERLLLLLENATSSVTRLEAARQLGQVQEKYPQELNTLLSRITKSYLNHTEWDTRIAASDAIEAIIDKIPHEWSSNSTVIKSLHPTTLTFETFSIEAVLKSGTPLLACSEEEYQSPDANAHNYLAQGFPSREAYFTNKRKNIEKRLGLSAVPGLNSGLNSIGVTDADINGDSDNVVEPPPKRIKKEAHHLNGNLDAKDASQEWLELFESPPPIELHKWPLEWYYSRIRLGLASHAWEPRHGSACAIRAMLKKGEKVFRNCTNRHEWLIDISLRLITLLALDRFGDFVSDSVVAPIRETAAQGLGIAAKLLPEETVQRIIDSLTILVQYGTVGKNSTSNQQDIWPIRHGGLLGLRWIFAVNQTLLEYNFTSLFSLFCSSLQDNSDDCRQVTATILINIVDFICREHLIRGIELARIAWQSVRQGDDLTASTGGVVSLLSALMSHGKDELISVVVGQDASSILPSLLPLMLHSLRPVREASIESICSILECGTTINLDLVLQDTLNRAYYIALVENPKSQMSSHAQATWCRTTSISSVELLSLIADSNLQLWIMLASSMEQKPLDVNLISMLREQSPTDELFWMGHATAEHNRHEIYSETRYVLCHMISELFIKLGSKLSSTLSELLNSDEGIIIFPFLKVVQVTVL